MIINPVVYNAVLSCYYWDHVDIVCQCYIQRFLLYILQK